MQLVEAVELLALRELVEFQREGGLIVEAAIAAGRPLEMNADIGISSRAILDRAVDVGAIVAAQLLEVLVVERDRETAGSARI